MSRRVVILLRKCENEEIIFRVKSASSPNDGNDSNDSNDSNKQVTRSLLMT